MIWKLAAASVRGSGHVASGKPNQDAFDACCFDSPEGPAVVFALSDGAGSSGRSEAASARVVSMLVRLVLEWNRPLEELDHDTVQDWFGTAGTHLASVLTTEQHCSIEDLYCTALLGIFWPEGGLCAGIGDGAIAVKTASGWHRGTVPDVGQYAGETFFVTSLDNVRTRLQFTRFEESVERVAAFTDGLQPVLLQPGFELHPPVLELLLHPFSGPAEPATLQPQLEAFLNLPQILERTDDDKTIVLLVWAPAQG